MKREYIVFKIRSMSNNFLLKIYCSKEPIDSIKTVVKIILDRKVIFTDWVDNKDLIGYARFFSDRRDEEIIRQINLENLDRLRGYWEKVIINGI